MYMFLPWNFELLHKDDKLGTATLVNRPTTSIVSAHYKKDWGQPACPMVWKKYEEEDE